MAKYEFGLKVDTRIKCNYQHFETQGVLTEMLNDDYVRQRIQEEAHQVVKLSDMDLLDYIRKLIWLSIDYYRVDINKVREAVSYYAKV